MSCVDLDALRRKMTELERGSSPIVSARITTGSRAIDAALAGGLIRGALHEILPAGPADQPSAAGFAIALGLQSAPDRPIVWIRQDFARMEAGEIYAPGLAELGLSPERLILVHARDGPGVLRAGEEAARCPALGAVLIELWGSPKAFDLVTSRRLQLAAARSGVPLFLIRVNAGMQANAAMTRWEVRAAASRELEANAPGHPAFSITLLRNRAGVSQRSWIVEWDRDAHIFNDAPALSGGMASLPASRPHPAPDEDWRKAG